MIREKLQLLDFYGRQCSDCETVRELADAIDGEFKKNVAWQKKFVEGCQEDITTSIIKMARKNCLRKGMQGWRTETVIGRWDRMLTVAKSAFELVQVGEVGWHQILTEQEQRRILRDMQAHVQDTLTDRDLIIQNATRGKHTSKTAVLGDELRNDLDKLKDRKATDDDQDSLTCHSNSESASSSHSNQDIPRPFAKSAFYVDRHFQHSLARRLLKSKYFDTVDFADNDTDKEVVDLGREHATESEELKQYRNALLQRRAKSIKNRKKELKKLEEASSEGSGVKEKILKHDEINERNATSETDLAKIVSSKPTDVPPEFLTEKNIVGFLPAFLVPFYNRYLERADSYMDDMEELESTMEHSKEVLGDILSTQDNIISQMQEIELPELDAHYTTLWNKVKDLDTRMKRVKAAYEKQYPKFSANQADVKDYPDSANNLQSSMFSSRGENLSAIDKIDPRNQVRSILEPKSTATTNDTRESAAMNRSRRSTAMNDAWESGIAEGQESGANHARDSAAMRDSRGYNSQPRISTSSIGDGRASMSIGEGRASIAAYQFWKEKNLVDPLKTMCQPPEKSELPRQDEAQSRRGSLKGSDTSPVSKVSTQCETEHPSEGEALPHSVIGPQLDKLGLKTCDKNGLIFEGVGINPIFVEPPVYNNTYREGREKIQVHAIDSNFPTKKEGGPLDRFWYRKQDAKSSLLHLCPRTTIAPVYLPQQAPILGNPFTTIGGVFP